MADTIIKVESGDTAINENTAVRVEGKKTVKNLYLIGDVDESLSKDIIKAIFETNWKKEKISNLNIYVTSEGGYLKDCFAIIDAVDYIRNEYDIHVTTFGLGEVASAGFFLFLMGDTRVLFPNCKAFVHEHIVSTSDATFGERKREARDEQALYETYVNHTAKRLGCSKTKAKNLLKKNRFLTPKEISRYNVTILPDELDD